MILSKNKIKSIISGFSKENILVIGDLMLDAYFWGKTERISPEAPVPIVEVQSTNFNPGGAANVALNLAGLGAKVSLFGMVGNDENGDRLITQLNNQNVDISPIISMENYKTPIKTRVIAQDQQVVRIDQENNESVDFEHSSMIKSYLENNANKINGIIIADYNKGLLSKESIELIINYANLKSIPIYVDPKKDNFFEYNNVRLFKPNGLEFKNAVNSDLLDEDFIENGKILKNKLNSELLLVTRGAENSILFHDNETYVIPTEPHGVNDVSGAGDTVISVFALADLCGAIPVDSAYLANYAAKIVCSQVGVVPITAKGLLQ